MMKVKCNECNKFLFEIEDGTNPGSIGAVCQDKGFVYKNAFLYSDKYSSLFFCNHECGKSFYNKHIPKNQEVTQQLNELKDSMLGNIDLALTDQSGDSSMGLNINKEGNKFYFFG